MNGGAVIAYAAKLMGAMPFYDKKRKRWHTYAEGFRAIQVAKLTGPHMHGQKKELAFAMVTQDTFSGDESRSGASNWPMTMTFRRMLEL